MINTNYVPEWYISPFEHVKYTLARNQMHMDLLFDDMSDSDEFMSMGLGAQADYYDKLVENKMEEKSEDGIKGGIALNMPELLKRAVISKLYTTNKSESDFEKDKAKVFSASL